MSTTSRWRPVRPATLYRFQKFARRNKLEFGTASAVAAAVVIGLVISTVSFVKERDARRRAVVAENAAREQARIASAAAAQTRMTLSAADLAQAIRLIADGRRSDALAYLMRSLSSNPSNSAAMTRLATLLEYHSWEVPSLILRHDDRAIAQFSPDGKRIVTASGKPPGCGMRRAANR